MAVMAEYARKSQHHHAVRRLAERICAGLQSKDYLSEILAVYYFVLANSRYMNDPRQIELVRAPWQVIAEIDAGRMPSLDCDDMITLIAALLLAIGREVRIVTLAFRNMFFRGKRQYQHVVLQVREPRTGVWILLDPVAAEDCEQMVRRVQAAKIWPVA